MTIPTLTELQQSIAADLRNRLQIPSIVGRAIINAISFVQAAKLKLFYLQAAFIYKNIFPDTADPESLQGSLSRFGFIKLGRYPTPATAGEYSVEVTGEIGATIISNTTYKSLDTSTSPDKLFVLDTTFTFTDTTGNILLRALELGVDAKLEIDDKLQLTQPIVDVDSYGIVTAISTTPTEAENIEDYRKEIVAKFRTAAMGGSKADFRAWGNEAPGVRQIYPYITEAGIIDLYIEATPEDSTDGHGTPSAAIIQDVEVEIELSDPPAVMGHCPMGVFDINYTPINTVEVDVIITNLSDDSYLTAIGAAIDTMLLDVRPYIAGVDNLNDANMGILYEADIYNVVRNVIDSLATFESLQLKVDGTPVSLYTFSEGNIPFLNSLTSV
jgi:uncharacterized phage protein gp47/JayE